MANVRASLANLKAYGDRAHAMLASSIQITEPMLSDPVAIINLLAQINDPGQILGWATSFETMMIHKTKEYSPENENFRVYTNKDARWNSTISNYAKAFTQMRLYFAELERWLVSERSTVNALHQLIQMITESVDTYLSKHMSKNKTLEQLVLLADKKFSTLCSIVIAPDRQNIIRKIHARLIENPQMLFHSAASHIGKSASTVALLANAENTSQRKLALQNICGKLIDAFTRLKQEKEEINAFQTFDTNILSIVIDALKYRRERTMSKLNNLFSNAELCRQRAVLLDRCIARLENGECKNVVELNALLSILKTDNASNTMPYRFIDKLGGLNKLLVAHEADTNDFTTFKESAEKFRQRRR